MIPKFLKFSIRKNITKKNKSINHLSFLQSLTIQNKTIFLAKYHKKKLIASILLLVIIWTYDLQKSINSYHILGIYRYVKSIRSPIQFAHSMFQEDKAI
jgi:hypothetical protein